MSLLKSQTYCDELHSANEFEELSDIAMDFSTTDNAREWEKAGPIIGKLKNDYIYDSSDNHVGCFAATGAMKTRRVILPMLFSILYAGESAIIHDPKAELYKRTSGLAKKLGYEIIVLNFRDSTHSNCWNPLAEMYKKMRSGDISGAKEAIDDLFSITSPTSPYCEDPYWTQSARSLGGALTELMMACGDDDEINFLGIYQLLEDMKVDDGDFKGDLADTLELMQEDSLLKINILASGRNADRTFACISSETKNAVSIFTQNKAILNMLSQNDFAIEDCLKKKTLVYLITPDEKTTYNSLVSLFVKQSYEIITAYAQNSPEGRLSTRMNYVLEEFGNLPKIPDLVAMLSAGRGRNIRFAICMQDMGAIRYKYQDVLSTILGNLTDLVFLFSREHDLLNYLSSLCGERADGTPLVSTSLLQQLDKVKGEALLLVDRKKPYITTLPDIDEYDFEKESPYPLPETPKAKIKAFRIKDVRECSHFLDEYERTGKVNESVISNLEKYKKCENLYSKIWERAYESETDSVLKRVKLNGRDKASVLMDMIILPEALNHKTLNLPERISYSDEQGMFVLGAAVNRFVAEFKEWVDEKEEFEEEDVSSMCDLVRYCIYYICLVFQPEYADIYFVYQLLKYKLTDQSFFTRLLFDIQDEKERAVLKKYEEKYHNCLEMSEIKLIKDTKALLEEYVDSLYVPARNTSIDNWLAKMEADCKQYKHIW